MTTLAIAPRTQLDVFKNAGIVPSAHSDADFDAMASSGGYLPRLTQFTDASARVKKRELTVGFYLVAGKDDQTALGEDVTVVPISWRFKALETPPGGRPISSTDKDSALFKSIASRSGQANSNCQAGIEFLVWVPDLSKFATYLMGSKTALREAAKVKPFMGCPITIKTATFENPQNIWQGPKVYECTTPVTSLPEATALTEVVEKFKNPPVENAPERIDADAKGGKTAARAR